jgi:hypothetical protein
VTVERQPEKVLEDQASFHCTHAGPPFGYGKQTLHGDAQLLFSLQLAPPQTAKGLADNSAYAAFAPQTNIAATAISTLRFIVAPDLRMVKTSLRAFAFAGRRSI